MSLTFDRAPLPVPCYVRHVLLGSARPLHLVLWGSVHTETDAVSMTVGLPASALAPLGISPAALSPGYVLPLALGGTADKPRLADIKGAAGRVAQLLLWQRLGTAAEGAVTGGCWRPA